jgi:hypothetical protein
MASKVRDLAHPISMAAYEATDGQSRPNDHPTLVAPGTGRATRPGPIRPTSCASSKQNKLNAKHEIHQVLDRYREKYCIGARQVNETVWGYVDDLLSDFFYEKEEVLRAEMEADIERENQRPRLARHERRWPHAARQEMGNYLRGLQRPAGAG